MRVGILNGDVDVGIWNEGIGMEDEEGERRGIEDLDGGGFGVDSKVLDMANAWLGWVGLVVEFDGWL